MTSTADNSRTAARQYLAFVLAAEHYCVDILRVQEIKSFEIPTPVPGLPVGMPGVINLRGAAVPLLDLRQRFELPALPEPDGTAVVVLNLTPHGSSTSLAVGLMVDEVSEVHDLAPADLQPPPAVGASTRYLQGLALVDGQVVMVLDVDHLLDGMEASLVAASVPATA